METIRTDIINAAREQIKSIGIKVDYKYDFNPFDKVILKTYVASYPRKKLSKFNEDLLT